MNKNFEEEYKKSAIDDTPDLWNRIEAGIDAKTNSSTKVNPASKERKVVPFYKKYQGLLAACICLIVVIPAAIIGLKANGQMSFSDKASTESAEVAASEDTYMEELAAEEAAVEEAAVEEAAVEETAETESDAAEAHKFAATAEALKPATVPNEGMTLREIKLLVTAVSLDNCTATIEEDPNSYFEAGDTVSFTKDSYLKLDFESGSSYTVTMNYYADEAIQYEVIKAVKVP